jgi:hypothetical protein
MYRLGHLVNSEWRAHSYAPIFKIDERIVAGVPNGDPAVIEALVECLAPPFYLLYILHTSREEGQEGRYQSPALARSEVKQFLARFGPFFSADSRFDLWVHSPSDKATVVWDRHNQLFAYGPIEQFASALYSLGFSSGSPQVPVPHEHHYRQEFDHLAKDLLVAIEWTFSPLRPEDEQ